MPSRIKRYYPQESVPDDYALLVFDSNRQGALFRTWWEQNGERIFQTYIDEETDPWAEWESDDSDNEKWDAA